MSDEKADVRSSISKEEYHDLIQAFGGRTWVDTIFAHEGATHTFIFESPHGHLGISVSVAPGKGDMHISVNEWEKEEHHELDDEWVWVKSDD